MEQFYLVNFVSANSNLVVFQLKNGNKMTIPRTQLVGIIPAPNTTIDIVLIKLTDGIYYINYQINNPQTDWGRGGW